MKKNECDWLALLIKIGFITTWMMLALIFAFVASGCTAGRVYKTNEKTSVMWCSVFKDVDFDKLSYTDDNRTFEMSNYNGQVSPELANTLLGAAEVIRELKPSALSLLLGSVDPATLMQAVSMIKK